MGIVSGLGPAYGMTSGSLRATRATSGDYSAVEQFLCVDLRRIPVADFHDQIEMPETHSDLRLLLKHNERIVGHVHLRFRDIRWGKARLAIGRFGPLDLLPEYRNPSVIAVMLEEIEHMAREKRTVLIGADLADISRGGALPTWPSHWLTTAGFTRFEANPRSILAELEVRADKASAFHKLEYAKSLNSTRIRPFRQVELPALMKIYRSHETAGFGFMRRSESYWQSLVRRFADVQIFVAVDHHQNRGIKQRGGKIVAYAVVDGDEILEILSEPQNILASEQLLARICADAVERNCRAIRLHSADQGDHLTEICVAAGSKEKTRLDKIRRAGIACVPSEKLLVRRLSSELLRRWQPASSAKFDVLGWGLGERACRLTISEKGAKLLNGNAGTDRLICSHQIWTRLLIGELNAPAAFAANLLEASTPQARRLAEVLFPEISVWRAAWDNSIYI